MKVHVNPGWFISDILFSLYGLFTLPEKGTGVGKGNGTGTIGNNVSWSLFLFQTSLNISTWYYTFHLVPLPIQAPFPCSVNIITLDPNYNEFGYNDHPAIRSGFLSIKIIDSNSKKFGYNEHALIKSSCFYICLLTGTVTQCNYNMELTSETLHLAG